MKGPRGRGAAEGRTREPPADDWDAWSEPPLEGGERTRRAVFLGREIYRRRRIMDAARLLPAFGAALLLLPMLWAPEHGTGAGAVYTFVVWIGLIAIAAILARRLAEPLREADRTAAEDGDG